MHLLKSKLETQTLRLETRTFQRETRIFRLETRSILISAWKVGNPWMMQTKIGLFPVVLSQQILSNIRPIGWADYVVRTL
jgi:hypothetical protein